MKKKPTTLSSFEQLGEVMKPEKDRKMTLDGQVFIVKELPGGVTFYSIQPNDMSDELKEWRREPETQSTTETKRVSLLAKNKRRY